MKKYGYGRITTVKNKASTSITFHDSTALTAGDERCKYNAIRSDPYDSVFIIWKTAAPLRHFFESIFAAPAITYERMDCAAMKYKLTAAILGSRKIKAISRAMLTIADIWSAPSPPIGLRTVSNNELATTKAKIYTVTGDIGSIKR